MKVLFQNLFRFCFKEQIIDYFRMNQIQLFHIKFLWIHDLHQIIRGYI